MTPTNTEALAAEWQKKAADEASRMNSAYDYYGMDNTPESVDPLGAKMAAELRRLSAVEAERDALRADAQRYRWLRTQHESGKSTAFAVFAPDSDDENTATHYEVGFGPGELDAAIDAAMKGTQA